MPAMKKKPLYLQSTEVPVSRTVLEVQHTLIEGGARSIATDINATGNVIGLRWMMLVRGIEVWFQMPARIQPVYKALYEQKNANARHQKSGWQGRLQEQAERIAWRQLLAWVKAQFAMIDTGMIQTHEAFMQYSLDRSGRTFFEVFEQQQLALPAPERQA